MMRLHVAALGLTAGIVWGGAVFLVALANMVWPNYGLAFLGLAGSIYPGYHAVPGIGSAMIGGLYGLVDGAIGGAIFAWLYNTISARFRA